MRFAISSSIRVILPIKSLAIGRGETSLIDDNTTKAGRAQNRRVEFHLQVRAGANVNVQKNNEEFSTFEEGDRGAKSEISKAGLPCPLSPSLKGGEGYVGRALFGKVPKGSH